MAEDTRHGSSILGIGDVLLKSRSAVHADRYGPDVAVQISLEFVSEDADGALARVIEDVWSVRRGPNAFRHAVAALEAATARDRAGVHAATMDMTAAIVATSSDRAAPPRWLEKLREELEEIGLAGVDVSARARQAGVHPVHASRLFRACYGASITDHAQTHAVRRAVAELIVGASLSDAAITAGFYDQSHMNRVFRRIVRRTPGQCRSICTLSGC